jgi:hypothetical protein
VRCNSGPAPIVARHSAASLHVDCSHGRPIRKKCGRVDEALAPCLGGNPPRCQPAACLALLPACQQEKPAPRAKPPSLQVASVGSLPLLLWLTGKQYHSPCSSIRHAGALVLQPPAVHHPRPGEISRDAGHLTLTPAPLSSRAINSRTCPLFSPCKPRHIFDCPVAGGAVLGRSLFVSRSSVPHTKGPGMIKETSPVSRTTSSRYRYFRQPAPRVDPQDFSPPLFTLSPHPQERLKPCLSFTTDEDSARHSRCFLILSTAFRLTMPCPRTA